MNIDKIIEDKIAVTCEPLLQKIEELSMRINSLGKEVKFLSAKQVIEITGFSNSTLFSLEKKGKLPFSKVGKAKRYNSEDVYSLMRESKIRKRST